MKSLSLTAGAKAPESAARRRVRFGIKLALGLALVAWLVLKSGWQKIAASLAAVNPGWLLAALVIFLLGQSLCAWKWGVLARSLGFRRTLHFYWVNYLGAMFPSLFLPTSMGGDIFRVLALARGGGDKVDATVSVLADRGTGILGMSWVAALTCLYIPDIRLPVLAEEGIYAVAAALTLGFVLPFFYRPAFARRGFLGRALVCWDDPQALLISLGAAFVFQALSCVIFVLLGQALALPISAGYYFLFCPVVSLVSLAPVTPNGVGVREATLMALFPLAGITTEQSQVLGISFGLAWSAMVTLAALTGGALLFFAGREAGWSSKVEDGEADARGAE